MASTSSRPQWPSRPPSLGPSCACWGSIIPERQAESRQEHNTVESDTQKPCQLCNTTPRQTCYLWEQAAQKQLAKPEALYYKGIILSFKKSEASYSVALDRLGVKGRVHIPESQVASGRPEEDAWVLVSNPGTPAIALNQPGFIFLNFHVATYWYEAILTQKQRLQVLATAPSPSARNANMDHQTPIARKPSPSPISVSLEAHVRRNNQPVETSASPEKDDFERHSTRKRSAAEYQRSPHSTPSPSGRKPAKQSRTQFEPKDQEATLLIGPSARPGQVSSSSEKQDSKARREFFHRFPPDVLDNIWNERASAATRSEVWSSLPASTKHKSELQQSHRPPTLRGQIRTRGGLNCLKVLGNLVMRAFGPKYLWRLSTRVSDTLVRVKANEDIWKNSLRKRFAGLLTMAWNEHWGIERNGESKACLACRAATAADIQSAIQADLDTILNAYWANL